MRASYALCVAAALVFSGIAWLLSLLLADNLFDDMSADSDIDFVMLDIEERLNSEPDTQATLKQLESDYGVFILADDGSDLDNPENDFDNKLQGQLQDQLESDLYSDDPSSSELEEFETTDLLLENGSTVSVMYPMEASPFFTAREWLHLALQSLAALATVFLTILIMNNRLKVLDGATRDAQFQNIEQPSADPVEKAVVALNYAKQSIMQFSESQKSAAADHRDLLASVAHEFRNPLARLQFANEMAMERTGDEQKALFEEANIAAVELDDLVRETLRYSRISSLDVALVKESLAVEDIFRDIAESATTSNKNVSLRIQYPEQECFINADKRLFTRALTNLVDNAFRYASSTVTLGVKELNDTFVFTIQDDGKGIPAIHHDKLFEPFYRVEPSRSRDTGGFGLGLSIVKSICDRHGAKVSLHSDGAGACFSIAFPRSTYAQQ